MTPRLKLLFRFGLIWLVYFLFARLLFMVYNIDLYKSLSLTNWLGAFYYGFKLDLSVAGYFLALASLIIIIDNFIRSRIFMVFLQLLNGLLLFISTIIVVVDIELYRNWGYRMDVSPLAFLKNPGEAAASTDIRIYLLLITLFLGLVISTYYLFKIFVFRKISSLKKGAWYHSLVYFIIFGLMIIPVRGGFGLAPINQGSVYFSNQIAANHAALNVVWNFNESLVNKKKGRKVRPFMPNIEAEQIFNTLYEESHEKIEIVLNTQRPNILILILESFSSNVIGVLGGEAGITPNLNNLTEEGILFEHIYAAGTRSDKGLVGIMAGWPSTEKSSIMLNSKKSESLPSLVRILRNEGYSSKFYYGGDLDFANMRSFIFNMGFEESTSEDNFSTVDKRSKWGAPDHILFDTLLNDLNRAREPFVNMVFTLSSHEPFDVPYESEFMGNDLSDKFRNSVMYSDHWLGWFIDEAKKQQWWDSSLVVIIADHGSRLPGRLDDHEEKRFRIPMLWLGGALEVQDTLITKYGDQTDLPATILGQMGMDYSDFRFSKNLFTNTPEFAFYNFANGFGFIMPGAYVVWDHVARMYLVEEGDYKLAAQYGEALFQIAHNDYLRR